MGKAGKGSQSETASQAARRKAEEAAASEQALRDKRAANAARREELEGLLRALNDDDDDGAGNTTTTSTTTTTAATTQHTASAALHDDDDGAGNTATTPTTTTTAATTQRTASAARHDGEPAAAIAPQATTAPTMQTSSQGEAQAAPSSPPPPIPAVSAEAPPNAWSQGPPQFTQRPLEMVTVPPAVAAVMCRVRGGAPENWMQAPRLPKKVAEMVGGGGGEVFATQLKHGFADITSAALWEENFRRVAIARAASLVLVTTPGMRSWLFLFGIVSERRTGSAEQRCVTVTAGATNEIPLPTTLLERTRALQRDAYVLQGTKVQLDKWATNVVVNARVGQASATPSETDVFEAVGIPKDGAEDHLLMVPAAFVQSSGAIRARGATVALPFGAFPGVKRFAVAGFLRSLLGPGAFALVSGFDVRLVAPAAWTQELRSKILAATWGLAKEQITHRLFTDAPPQAVREIGGEPAAETVVEAAAAAEAANPAEAGVVITALRATPADAWKELVVALGGRLLRSNICAAAVAFPRALGTQLVGRSCGDGAFFLRAAAAFG